MCCIGTSVEDELVRDCEAVACAARKYGGCDDDGRVGPSRSGDAPDVSIRLASLCMVLRAVRMSWPRDGREGAGFEQVALERLSKPRCGWLVHAMASDCRTGEHDSSGDAHSTKGMVAKDVREPPFRR